MGAFSALFLKFSPFFHPITIARGMKIAFEMASPVPLF
jgi:hypothetical protein